MKSEIVNEVLINNNMIPMDNVYDICKATIKIILKNNRIGSGFFLKFERNNKNFYCIMTNQHVIESNIVRKKEEIVIIYENEKKNITIKLDKKERIIECFNDEDSVQIDAIIIEIIEKDNIDDSYFLSPNLDYYEKYESFINKDIQVLQYPCGKNLSLAMGKITEISSENDYMFYHNADTIFGSSGSPIVLNGENTAIGIHTGGLKDKKENVGYFIGIIIDIMRMYKKNGEGKEYYKDGKLKYEGNFLDDEYDGEGKFYDENGEIYIGQFKNGKKNGNFCVIKDNELIKEGEFKNDEFINKEKSDNQENFDNKFENNDKQEYEDDSNNAQEDNNVSDNNMNSINRDDNYENSQENKNENSNNNDNNIDNNPNNNNINNNQDLINGIFKDAKIQFCNIFHGVGNFLGIVCTRQNCGHPVKSHLENGYGKWICQECPEDDNICHY